MKQKQFNTKIIEFIIEDENEFILFFDKNIPLLKNSIINLRGNVTDKIRNYILLKNIVYIESENNNIYKKQSINEQNIIIEEKFNEKEELKEELREELKEEFKNNIKEELEQKVNDVLKNSKQETFVVLNKTIRGGEEIVLKSDAVIFGRINNGASISSNDNLFVFGKIDGELFCNGQYLIIGQLGENSSLFFHNKHIKVNNNFKYSKISKSKNDELIIEEL